MRFSLLTATLGRTTELIRLFESLQAQTFRDFEIIVVDQNPDTRLVPIIQRFEGRLDIRRVLSAPGLSRARNVGLRDITGDVVCFPDDDCWYPADALERVNELLEGHSEWHGVVGDSVDEDGKRTLPWNDTKGRLSLPMSWRRSISYAIFLRTEVIERVGGFDETLGLGSGSPWGSGEDNDLVLRALKSGSYVEYDPAVQVFHPRLYPTADVKGWRKRHSYALGDGKLLQKHPMPVWWKALFVGVPTARAVLSLVRLQTKDSYSHWLTLKGRVTGLFSAKEMEPSLIPFPLQNRAPVLDVNRAPARARAAAAGTFETNSR
jgi:glycosyltransferase involved in cell wall biosynthesis